jgi:hypothetical protein
LQFHQRPLEQGNCYAVAIRPAQAEAGYGGLGFGGAAPMRPPVVPLVVRVPMYPDQVTHYYCYYDGPRPGHSAATLLFVFFHCYNALLLELLELLLRLQLQFGFTYPTHPYYYKSSVAITVA